MMIIMGDREQHDGRSNAWVQQDIKRFEKNKRKKTGDTKRKRCVPSELYRSSEASRDRRRVTQKKMERKGDKRKDEKG